MNEADKHIQLLGRKAKEKVTALKGIITSISFDLYWCIQAIVTADDIEKDSRWFDLKRLEISNYRINMNVPNFTLGYVAQGLKGVNPKPMQNNKA